MLQVLNGSTVVEVHFKTRLILVIPLRKDRHLFSIISGVMNCLLRDDCVVYLIGDIAPVSCSSHHSFGINNSKSVLVTHIKTSAGCIRGQMSMIGCVHHEILYISPRQVMTVGEVRKV